MNFTDALCSVTDSHAARYSPNTVLRTSKYCIGKIPFESTQYVLQDGYLFILTAEQLLNKKQASGLKILSAVRDLPRYSVAIRELRVAQSTVISNNAVDVELDIQCSVAPESASLSKSKAQRSRHFHDMTYILTLTSDLDFIDFRRIPLS